MDNATIETIGKVVVTTANVIDSPLMGLLSIIVPQAAPIIAIMRQYAPAIAAVTPVVVTAVEQGKPAFDAAISQAPQIAKVFTQILDHLPVGASQALGSTHDAALENLTRNIVGLPRMSFDLEMKWMNDAQPPNDDSRFSVG